MPDPVKALALVSGGLDSALAVAIMARQGIQVEGLFFSTGFCLIGHHLEVGKKKSRPSQPPVFAVAAELGIPLSIIDISSEYRQILLNPKFGYGSGMNPCKDCRIFMLKKAKEILDKGDARFIFTGEVLGQRPMSQHRRAMELIEREAELSGYLLRPLSAKLMPITIPETEGWVDRQSLYDINGRSRRGQIKLADEFKVKVFSQPAGGCCFLPDKQFSIRLRDLLIHEDGQMVEQSDFNLLKAGRHFRLGPDLKIVVGRDEDENRFLEYYTKEHMSLQAEDTKGPLTIVIGKPEEAQISLIAGITAAYSQNKNGEEKRIAVQSNGDRNLISVRPVTREKLHQWIIK